MLTFMKYVLTITLVREGRVDNIEGGWMSSEKFQFHAKLWLSSNRPTCCKGHQRESIGETALPLCHTLLVLSCFFIVFTLILNCLNLFIVLYLSLNFSCSKMYAPGQLGLCLIQTKSELYRICSSFRFYNRAGKYILVERMNDYYPCEK